MKNNKEKSDIKFSEKFSLKFRKTIIVNKLFTLVIVLALVASFIGLNVWIQKLNLPEIDVTANKIYTLSDSSKKALEKLDQDVKIYAFGIKEDDSVMGLVKQYCDASDRISYEMLSSESNLEKVKKFELEDGYSIIVVESGDSYKIIDTSTEFTTYDYTTYAEVDITEQTLTNSILNLSTENKPKVYFVQGHKEFTISKPSEDSSEQTQSELGVLATYLNNEAFEIETLDLMTAGSVPEDCDVLAIMSPQSDYVENEAQAVIDYINKGGNIFMTKDIQQQTTEFTNFNKILEQYGVSIDSGYVVETNTNNTVQSYPYIFKPMLSTENEITADISSDSYVLLAYAQKLSFAEGVEYTPLMETSESAKYVTDFTTDVDTAAGSAEVGKYTISALVTKTISEGTSEETAEDSEETETQEEKDDSVKSELVICGDGMFVADYVVPGISDTYPISSIGSNKDFAINSIAHLADKESGLTIRKDMSGTSYVFKASAKQNAVVLIIIFTIPIVIIIAGIIVGKVRKRRK